MTLPPSEIERITGKKYGAVQSAQLTRLGIDHRMSGDGKPLVLQSVYEAWLGHERNGRDEYDERGRLIEWNPWGDEHQTDWLVSNLEKFAVSPDDIFDGAATDFDIDFYGVYFLIRNEILQYIGKTSEWSQRHQAHRRNGRRFDEAFFLTVPPDLAEIVEETYLNLAYPPENLRFRASASFKPLRKRLIELDWGNPGVTE